MVTRAPTSDDGAPGVSPGGSGAAASGASGGLGPDDDLPAGSAGRRRAGRLPSLAELGAFDLPEPAPPRPRLSGRLTEEDLRGLPARGAPLPSPSARPGAPAAPSRPGASAPSSRPGASEPSSRPGASAPPSRPGAATPPPRTSAPAPASASRNDAPAPAPSAPAEARPFVWPPLKDKVRPVAPPAQAVPSRGARSDEAPSVADGSTSATGPVAAAAVDPLDGAALRAAPTPAPAARDGENPRPGPGGSTGPDAAGRTVPAVNVRWADLHAAVAAGWMTPAAAHSLWARWLARKPLMHVEADAADLAALEEEEAARTDAAPASSKPASQAPIPPDDALPDGSSPARAAAAAPETSAASADVVEIDTDADAPAAHGQPPSAPPPGPSTADAPHRAPDPPEPEVLEPASASVSDADARRAAHWAFHGPRVEVVDVIEVPSLSPRERVTSASIAAQYALALALAVAAAVCIGLGSTLFGPWGAALAAAGWTIWVWRHTGRAHRRGAALTAQIGAHLVLPLVALTVWQVQIAAGVWPAVAPMDLFADAPLGGAVPDTAQRLDWRWLSLALGPLLAALYWLVRLRRPALLVAVTLLLWAVAFQAVAGVLGALGLAFHGMSTFMLLMGLLTLVAAQSIDLRSRRAGLADFAQWPYLTGAMLLGLGWVSLSVLPGWVLLPRYLGWTLFVLWALSVRRVAVVGIALALAGFELAWGLGRWAGSDLVSLGLWALCLGASTVAVVFLSARTERWSAPLRVWMPAGWRIVYARRGAGRAPPARAPR